MVQERGRLNLAAVDAAAAGEGLSPGLPLAEARALVPELATAPLDPAGDAGALERLAEWCGRYTPWTAIDTGAGRDGVGEPGGGAGLLLDITGCAHLFGGEAALLADLTRRLSRFGFAARAALAPSLGGAWALARFGLQGDGAGEGRTWNIVPPESPLESLRAALAPLPPVALRLAPATCDLLARLGLRRIGDLYALPPATLAPRFGPMVARRLAQALGQETEPISPRQPVEPFLVRRVFAEPIATPEDIARGLESLLGALARRLAAEERGARRLSLGLYRVDGTLRRLAVGTSRARRDPAHLARLFAGHLDKIDPGFGIEVMTLAAPVTEGLSALQMVLPERRETGTAQHGSDLAELVDRLGSRLGLDKVIRPAPRESHVPERAVAAAPAIEAGTDPGQWPCPLLRQAQDEDKTLNARPQPEPLISSVSRDEGGDEGGARHAKGPPTLTLPLEGGGNLGPQPSSPSPLRGEAKGAHARRAGGGDADAMDDDDRAAENGGHLKAADPVQLAAQPNAFRPRPVRLLPRPEPVEAIALLPDHAPAQFRWRRLTHNVVRAEGPERIEPEWWLALAEAAPESPGEPARDYFRVEAEDGRRYWLYRAAGRWFLHGVFA